MKKNRNWIIALILTATAGAVVLQNSTSSQTSHTATETARITDTVESPVSVDESALTPTYEGCAYVWAYHDDPELSDQFEKMVRTLDPNAKANVSLYGEDCIYADGHSTFGAMETDFYVHLPSEDLTDRQFPGNRMAKVLLLVTKIPREEIQGKYGFVEFWFETNNTENLIVRVPFQKYLDKGQGLDGEELFQLFFVEPVLPAPT